VVVVTTVGLVIEFCVLWLAASAICIGLAKAFIVLIVDPIEQYADRRQQVRDQKAQTAAAIERITTEADRSVERLEAAYVQARADMRRNTRTPRRQT